MLAQCVLVKLCGIDFKYSIVDSGSGRELQNQPIHNIAGLGEATGERPFRPLSKPMLFMPRSTVRIEVEEISVGRMYGYEDEVTKQRVGAELFIVLHGYKVLGFGTGLSWTGAMCARSIGISGIPMCARSAAFRWMPAILTSPVFSTLRDSGIIWIRQKSRSRATSCIHSIAALCCISCNTQKNLEQKGK